MAIQALAENPVDQSNQPMFSKNDLKKLIVPLVIEQALTVTVGMIDTVMVASVGESAVSGVSLVDTINLLLINLFTALASGGAIVAGQYLGRREKANSNHAAKQLCVAILFLSVTIMALAMAFNGPILSLFFGKIEADVMSNARSYFYITALSYPFIALYNAAAALFRGMGNSKVAMINALIMNLLNIIGNATFIYGFQWGAFGAGLSTLISRAIAATVMMWMLRNPKWEISVRSYSLRDIDFGMIKRILRIGIPSGLENSMFQIGRIILTSLVSGMGTVSIAAHAVANSLTGIAVIPGQAIGLAMITVTAQCVGAGEHDQANGHIKYLLKLSQLFMLAINVLIMVCMNPILGLYRLSEASLRYAWQIMLLHGIGAATIWTMSLTLPNALRAAGDAKYTMTVSIFSMWVFRIGCSYLLAYVFDMGVLSVWIAMVVDWAVRGICFTWRWLRGRWKNIILL